MPHQYVNHVINQSTKRRMHEDDEENDQVMPFTKQDQGTKRLNDLSQEFNPNNEPPKADSPLPSLTYASPDYRPPPRADALWLQPVPPPPQSSLQSAVMPSTPLDNTVAQPMMEEDSTDEDDILPCFNASTTASSEATKQSTGFDWVMAEQC
ncbi:hypothetical protein BCR42DRAFT_401656 [Absidia repens]|uniref:Uncharacterized protein n=1 Tax=Absidia repens TaxID=90262 RepID=A0A1X2J2V7_9FUNG|nr:hypothetical protein BCR42DRAFT_401656 [Absidia repens]